MQSLIWSPDGRYVLAATMDGNPGCAFDPAAISIRNAETGRHRGEFVGSSQSINGIAFLADEGTLVGGSIDGAIRFWDFAAAMKQIRALDDSLHKP